MPHDLTNLLPKDRIRALRRDYFLRLLTVATVLLTGVIVAHGTLLLPSYLYLSNVITERQAELETLSASLGSVEETEVNARVSALANDTTYLSALGTLPTGSAAIRELLLVPRPGITLITFTFTASKDKTPAQMTLSGQALTRDALRRFVQALSELTFVTAADLPISAYAKERDIEFTITLTGSFMP